MDRIVNERTGVSPANILDAILSVSLGMNSGPLTLLWATRGL